MGECHANLNVTNWGALAELVNGELISFHFLTGQFSMDIFGKVSAEFLL